MDQGQLPSIGKASKKKEIIKNLDKYFLQIQVCSLLDWRVVPEIAASEWGGAVFALSTLNENLIKLSSLYKSV